jgi:hypothetical protein
MSCACHRPLIIGYRPKAVVALTENRRRLCAMNLPAKKMRLPRGSGLRVGSEIRNQACRRKTGELAEQLTD